MPNSRRRLLMCTLLLACDGGDDAASGADRLGSDVPNATVASSNGAVATGAPVSGSSSNPTAAMGGVGGLSPGGPADSTPLDGTSPESTSPDSTSPGTGGAVPSGGAAAMGSGGVAAAGADGTTASGGVVGEGVGAAAAGGALIGAGGMGGMGGESTATRSQCPEAPPAAQKDPAADRNLLVAKEEYQQLMQQEEPFVGTRGELPWHSHTPQQAASSPEQLFPLLVVLHGGYGREVEDGNILVDVAPYLLGSANGLLTEANLSAYPTYIIAPHCRVEEGCDFGNNEWASSGGAHFDVLAQPSVAGGTALELIQHVIETFQVDPARVYLTGNSMGGGGTWEFAQRHPELFAAVLPVSGHMPRLELLAPIVDAKLPVWAFGAVNDNTNPYADTVEAINYIDQAGGCAWLTTYNGAGHDDALWSSPYLEPGLWPWLFAQSNPSASQ